MVWNGCWTKREHTDPSTEKTLMYKPFLIVLDSLSFRLVNLLHKDVNSKSYTGTKDVWLSEDGCCLLKHEV